jgi:hypothetical protein
VQDQIRYAFVSLNLGGLTPADADVTWTRRFGDCKGKTALLLALLHELGIEAQPVLVSTTSGDGLDQRLPTLVFDHVIVRARIGGRDYWLDGTRTGDRAIDDIQTPNFHWVLPVQAAGARLVELAPPPLAKPAFESLLRLDASKGLDAPAPAHAENLFRGDMAVEWNQLLSAAGHDDAERGLRQYWRARLPWVDVAHVEFAFDDAGREMRFLMDGSAAMDWSATGGGRDFQIADSGLGYDPSFKREPGPDADAPYAVGYPNYDQRTVEITLPDGGAGFGLFQSADVDQTIAGVRYQRRSRIEAGVVHMTATQQSLTPEFPAAEADADAAALRRLAEFDVTVYSGPGLGVDADPADAATPAPAPAPAQAPPPTTAAQFAGRAVGFLAKRDYPHAIADLDAAVGLDPTSAKYVYDRGVAHFSNTPTSPWPNSTGRWP